MTPARMAATALAALFLVGLQAGPSDAAPAVVTAADQTFLISAHEGNLAEIAAGEDAGLNATTACVKDVGASLVEDHTRLDDALTALAGRLGVPLPDAPTPEQEQQLAAIREHAGTAAYDRAWLAAQAAAHEETLALIDRELDTGNNTEVRAAARDARPVVETHLERVRGGECHPAPA
ncbi:DUF4142 domain-containing protein [Streptomyces sp. DSM 44917]|uniref:DUF4142 domain-containing protein n=1 Tax=Streptomyces boetiae TaxID=3075541 RepID=A0ABU2L4Y6_9ACTN|nr:DUF4142 domain-containing protein [Streptomyces sp. DSM 44917]MDT0306625.1 DUF4142 domain-containing protein [Streptomyces sp. DSM 44917]